MPRRIPLQENKIRTSIRRNERMVKAAQDRAGKDSSGKKRTLIPSPIIQEIINYYIQEYCQHISNGEAPIVEMGKARGIIKRMLKYSNADEIKSAVHWCLTANRWIAVTARENGALISRVINADVINAYRTRDRQEKRNERFTRGGGIAPEDPKKYADRHRRYHNGAGHA